MTIAWSEDIYKDDTCILNLFTDILVSAKMSLVFTEEIRTFKFCTEVFVMLKYLKTKLNIPYSFSYLSLLRAIVLCKQYSRITVIW